MGELPKGYDHKYIYSQIGFNLKLTDFQAAIGVAQLQKLPGFIKKRKENYKKYYGFFAEYPKYFELLKSGEKEDPCWFGFPLLVKKDAPFTRNELTQYLEMKKIGTRNVFSGNLLRHPAYLKLKYKTAGKIINADEVMDRAFWIGVFPGINSQMIEYTKEVIKEFLEKYQ